MTRNDLALNITQLFSHWNESSAVHSFMHSHDMMRNHELKSIRALGRLPVERLGAVYLDLVVLVLDEIHESWYGVEGIKSLLLFLGREEFFAGSAASLSRLTRALIRLDEMLLGLHTNWQVDGDHARNVQNAKDDLIEMLIELYHPWFVSC